MQFWNSDSLHRISEGFSETILQSNSNFVQVLCSERFIAVFLVCVDNCLGYLWLCLYCFVWYFFFFGGITAPQWARASSFTRFLDQARWPTAVGMTPLDEWSASRRVLYLTTHDTHNRQTSMPPVGFEPRMSAGEWPQCHALESGTVTCRNLVRNIYLPFLVQSTFTHASYI
jgi:hypothetical protein